MYFFKRFVVISLAMLFTGAFTGVKKDLSIDCTSYILMEADTCTVLDEKSSDMRCNAGYLSKLMSILLIAEDIAAGEYSLSEELAASESVRETKGAVIWLESGDKLSVDELLKSVIVGNANDAMTVLAERASGSIEQFVMDMNAKAFDLGLKNTRFNSPWGYYDEYEYTSARDVAVICAELLKYDDVMPYFSIWRDFVKDGQVELVNENTMMNSFSKHIGFKACHNDKTGYCIAECGKEDDGAVFIAVIIGAADENSLFSLAKQLVKKGLKEYKVVTTMFPDEMLMPVKVRNGTESAVEIGIAKQGKAVIDKRGGELIARIVIPDYLDAPVERGQPVGTAAFYNEDTLVYETNIITVSGVASLSISHVFKSLLSKMMGK